MAANNQNDYDFLCTNDTRQIKLAIQGDAFFAATIQSETAKKVDLSGGTKNIESIIFAHCLKITRIIWPEDTGAIKRLAIHSADAMTTLDLSSLTNLEELSIFNCAELETLTGLGKTLKVVNLHGVNLSKLDLMQAKGLNRLNIKTLHADFALNLKQANNLQLLFLQGDKISCSLQHCPNLISVLVDGINEATKLEIDDCHNIVDAIFSPNKKNNITGLENCKKLIQHEVNDKKHKELIKLSTDFIAPILNIQLGAEDMETVIQKYGTIKERNHACIIMISLLSSMEKTLTNELQRQDPITKAITKEKHSPEEEALEAIVHVKSRKEIPVEKLQQARRFSQDYNEIIGWLKNINNRRENILLLEKKDMQDRIVINLLKQVQQRSTVTFLGIPYRILPTHRIYAIDAPKNLLTRPGQLLFNSRLALPPTFPVAAPFRPLGNSIAEKNNQKTISTRKLQEKLPEITRMLEKNGLITKSELRQSLNALNNFISAWTNATDAGIFIKDSAALSVNLSTNKKIAAKAGNSSPQTKQQTGDTKQDLQFNRKLTKQGEPLSPTALINDQTKNDLSPLTNNHHTNSIEQNLERKHKFSVAGQPLSDAQLLIDEADRHLEPLSFEHQGTDIEQDLDRKQKFSSPGEPLSPVELIDHSKNSGLNRLDIRLQDKNSEQDLEIKQKSGIPGELINASSELQNGSLETRLSNIRIEKNIQLELDAPLGGANKAEADNQPISSNPCLVSVDQKAVALNNLLHSEEQLTLSLQKLSEVAKKAALPNELLTEEPKLIDRSLESALAAIHYSRSIDIKIAEPQLLSAAQELSSAINELNKVCKAALSKSPVEKERDKLIDLLTKAKELLSSRTHHSSLYKAGINRAQIEITDSLLHNLKNNQALPLNDVNMSLQELMKDKELKTILQSEVELFRMHLTTPHRPAKRTE